MADSPAAEIAIDGELVDALLRQSTPEFAGPTPKRAAVGWDNEMWRIGDAHAVRLPRRALAVPLIRHEQRALTVIGPLLDAVGVRTPAPVFAGSPNEIFPWPWSIVPWLGGHSALTAPRTDNGRWAAALAIALVALHQESVSDAPHNPVRGVPLADRDPAMQERLAEIEARPELREAWLAGLGAPLCRERVWIHGDLHPGNILVDAHGLHALIDFGDVTAGDPAYDLAGAWMLFDEEGRARFIDATADRYDAATWTRARAWAAYLAAVFLTRSDDRPEMKALGASTADELVRR